MREVVAQGGGTFSDTMHIALTIVLSLLFLLAMAFGAVAFGKRFRVYSVATILTLVAFGAMASMQAGALATNEPTPWQGVYERVNVAAYLLWMVVLAIVLARPKRCADRGGARRSGRSSTGLTLGSAAELMAQIGPTLPNQRVSAHVRRDSIGA